MMDDIVNVVRFTGNAYYSVFDCLPVGKRPEQAYYYGNLSLLETPIVMICGSRRTSEYGRNLAYQCAESLSSRGITVISGWARGIDRTAHSGALDTNGDTIAFLPHGIDQFVLKPNFPGDYYRERLLIMSFIGRNEGFSTIAAYQRNRYMVAISSAVIVVEPGDTGGTWYSARQAVALKKPLYYLEGKRDDYCHRLEKMGAARIRMFDGRPLIEDVVLYANLNN